MDASAVPPLRVVGPDGSPLIVRPHGPTDTVADLARALRAEPGRPLRIDGRTVAGAVLLTDCGLRHGSAVTAAEAIADDGADPEPGAAPLVEWAVVAGPSCGGWHPLPPGRAVIGRSPSAAIRVDDRAIEAHHAVATVAGDVVDVRQLTGRSPIRGAGSPGADGGALQAGPGDALDLGASRVGFRSVAGAGGEVPAADGAGSVGGRLAPWHGDPWRRVVHRCPPPPAAPVPGPGDPPTPPGEARGPSATGLVGAAIAAGAACVMAAAMSQVLFAVFAAIGAIAALATWGVGWLAVLRERRRASRAHDLAVADFADRIVAARAAATIRHRIDHPAVSDLLALVPADGRDDGTRGGSSDVWRRRLVDDAPAWVTLGPGGVSWQSSPGGALDAMPDGTADCALLDGVAVPVPLEVGRTVAVHGDPRFVEAVARSFVLQLALLHGPADWQLVAVVGDVRRWSWLEWLPQALLVVAVDDPSAEEQVRRVADVRDRSRRLVVLTDDAGALARRTGALRRLLAEERCSGVALVPGFGPGFGPGIAAVPAIADQVIDVGSTGVVAPLPWAADVRAAGLSVSTADTAARWLAHLVDPECADEHAGVPSSVGLGDVGVDGLDADSVVRRWRSLPADPAPVAPVGMASDGVVDIDLVRDGPHALVAGTTGAGKSEFLRTLVVSLAARLSPDHVTFVLVDFKGGSTFDACAPLPHVVGMVTDLDDGLARRALVSLDAEIVRRERLLRDVGADDLAGYRQVADEPLPRLVVVIDEFAGLAAEHPELLDALVGIAQRGRSLGVHLVLATQRPAGVITEAIRANTNLRLALRLRDAADAIDVVGDAGPASFPRAVAGRAALRLGGDDLVVFQTATSSRPRRRRASRLTIDRSTDRPVDGAAGVESAASELHELVEAIVEAAVSCAIAAPHRPWSAPLPRLLERADLPRGEAWGGAIGVIDDPQRQTCHPLHWNPALGNLLIVGSLGAGVTSTAIAVLSAAMAGSPPSTLHCYVVDPRGDAGWDALAAWAHCGAVVRVSELERLVRLVERLDADIARRAAAGPHRDATASPQVVLVVDGLAPTRAALGVGETLETLAAFDRIVADGPALGVAVCATSDVGSLAALAFAAAERWVMHVDDGGAARALGATSIPPAGVPGRLRIVGSDLEAQVLSPEAARSAVAMPGVDGPPPIGVLPSQIDPDHVMAGAAEPSADGPEMVLPIGIGATDLAVASLVVPRGDHVFVGGTARTGVSGALAQLARAWAQQHHRGVVVRIDPGGPVGGDPTPLGDRVAALLDAGATVLVVVDDADRVDDDDGALAALAEARDPRVTIVAGARLDAARVAYGHWVRAVARRRCGVILTSSGEIDGDLLGATLPRRSIIAARPGLAWIVDRCPPRLVQIAALSGPGDVAATLR